MLQLLVLAEDSYYQWQRLRLERVRVVEPDRLASVVDRANRQLAADLRRDSEMVDLLHARLTAYATQRPLERLHPLAARDLQGNVTSLRQDLEEFAVARRMQVAGWSDSTRPTISDAVRELRDRTVATGQHAIKQASVVAEEVGGTATDVGRAVAGRASGLGQEARSRATSLARGRLQAPRSDRRSGVVARRRTHRLGTIQQQIWQPGRRGLVAVGSPTSECGIPASDMSFVPARPSSRLSTGERDDRELAIRASPVGAITTLATLPLASPAPPQPSPSQAGRRATTPRWSRRWRMRLSR